MVKEIVKVAVSPAPGVISVIASAGAGKTFVLTSVYIALLLKGTSPSEILGITFTNKAVEEMRDRVLWRLLTMAFAENKLDLELFSSSLKLSEEEIRERARLALENLLFNFSGFSLQTIDSFLNKLRLVFSFELGISPSADLRPSLGADVEVVVSRMLERSSEDKSLLADIKRFVNYYSETLSLYRSWDPLALAERFFPTYLAKQSHYGRPLAIPRLKGFSHLIEGVLRAKEEFLDACEKFEVKLHKNLAQLLSRMERDSLYLPKDFTSAYLSRRYRTKEGFADLVKGGSRLPKEVFENLFLLWNSFLTKFYELEFNFSSAYARPLLHIYDAILRELERFQKETDVAYLSLLQLYMARLDPVLVSEKLSSRYERYKYFLIDEFQDTSRSQWQALYPILEEALSSGGLLFCVGDPKQTIYRWRGSDPQMFDVLKKAFAVRQHWFVLRENWRSGPEIVRFNSELFSRVSERRDLLIGEEFFIDEGVWNKIAESYHPSRTRQEAERRYFSEVNTVEVPVDPGWSSEEIREEVLERLVEYLKGKDAGERCILVRRRSEARAVISALAKEGISVVSDESLTLASHPLIRDLICVLRWIAFPEERMFLNLFFLSDLWSRFTGKGRDYWERTLRVCDERSLESNLREITFGLNTSSLYLLVEDLLARLRIRELFPDQLIFVRGFLDVVWRWESEKGALLREFLEYWDRQEGSQVDAERLNLPVNPKSVRVMTIHTAKGLEFDEVILPFLTVRFGSGRSKGIDASLYWEVDEEIRVYYINRTMSQRHSDLFRLYSREFTQRVGDDLNLLYVALTRAKRRLTLFRLHPPPKGLTWQSFVDSSLGENHATNS